MRFLTTKEVMDSPEMAEQKAGQQEWGEERGRSPQGEAAGREGRNLS